MGSTMFEGGSITKCLQIDQVKLPQTKIINIYKRILEITSYYQDTTMYKDTRGVSVHNLPSMPQ
jgi:hypothetical protein